MFYEGTEYIEWGLFNNFKFIKHKYCFNYQWQFPKLGLRQSWVRSLRLEWRRDLRELNLQKKFFLRCRSRAKWWPRRWIGRLIEADFDSGKSNIWIRPSPFFGSWLTSDSELLKSNVLLLWGPKRGSKFLRTTTPSLFYLFCILLPSASSPDFNFVCCEKKSVQRFKKICNEEKQIVIEVWIKFSANIIFIRSSSFLFIW